MIDPTKVKKFWESRSDLYASVAFESIANLEHDSSNLEIKIRDETSKIFAWLPKLDGKTVLDLGAGVGQWAFRFAESGARKVIAVEYAKGLVTIGRNEALRRGVTNVEFVISAAENFVSSECFDVIFISGLFVYLNDDQADKLIANLRYLAGPDTIILLRDGSGVSGRYEINNRFSNHLQTTYSAIYRSPEEYIALFEAAGLSCLQQENMFPDGHLLNKYPETRLRIFAFEKT